MKIKIFHENNLKLKERFKSFLTLNNIEIVKIESASVANSKYFMLFYNEIEGKSPLYGIEIIGPSRNNTVPQNKFNAISSRYNILLTTVSSNEDAYYLYIIYEEKENT